MSDHANTQLEPCPWCPTERRETYNTEGGIVGVIIHDANCFLAACERRQILTPKGVAAWNSRASVAAPQGDALALIAQERQRQIAEEGYDAAHDDDCYGHSDGEIAQAAAAYALGGGRVQNIDRSRVIDIWPTAWGAEEDTIKRKPRRRQLVIAGALIVAEIERLQRREKLNHELRRAHKRTKQG